MSSTSDWRTWCRVLPEWRASSVASKHFQIYALLRNERNAGPIEESFPTGVHGVRNPKMINVIYETLESAYQRFKRDRRTLPKVGQNKKIPIYVFAVDDPDLGCGSSQMDELYFENEDFLPVIALASRYAEPDRRVELAQVQASAVHELSHVFNSAVLPYKRIQDMQQVSAPIELLRGWLWLDEALALDAEMEILPDVNDWLRYSLDWVDRPHRSLDHPQANYQSAFFIRYLRHRLGLRANRYFTTLWNKSAQVWDTSAADSPPVALTALTESWPRSLPVFCSATESDFFASGYCYDSYFLTQLGACSTFRKIHARYTKRFGWTWPLADDKKCESEFSLTGLACHYFQFRPTSTQPAPITVTIRTPKPATLKAELVLVNGRGHPRGERCVASRTTVQEGWETLHCQVPNFGTRSCDHAVLVVTNCAMGPGEQDDKIITGFKHEVRFKLEAHYDSSPAAT